MSKQAHEYAPEYAWADQRGKVFFSSKSIKGLLPIAPKWASSPHYKVAVLVLCRLAYDNKTSFIPGLPENPGDLSVFRSFCSRVAEFVERREKEIPSPHFSFAPLPAII